MIHFTKMQALGNDYVYIDAVNQELLKFVRTCKIYQ